MDISNDNLLTIVIPTAGRDTLERCLESMKPVKQGGWGIDIVVVFDSYSGKNASTVKNVCEKYFGEYIESPMFGYSDWGYPQLEWIYKTRRENGLYIMNMGDDDTLVSGVIPKLMEIIKTSPLQPKMVQSLLYPSPHRGNKLAPVLLWNDNERTIKRKHVTGQNLMTPNVPHLMGNMSDDFEFIRQTIENWNNNVQWVPIVTCECF